MMQEQQKQPGQTESGAEQGTPVLPFLRTAAIFAMLFLTAAAVLNAYGNAPMTDPGTGETLSVGFSTVLMSVLLAAAGWPCYALDFAAVILCSVRRRSRKTDIAAQIVGWLGIVCTAVWSCVLILGESFS